jgi:hypothetical protein
MLRQVAKPIKIVTKFTLPVVSTTICILVAEISLRMLGYYGSTVFNVENPVLVDDPVLNWAANPK